MLYTILLIILILMLLGAVPAWPHSRGWGYYPSGGLGLVIVIILILMLMHRGVGPPRAQQTQTSASDSTRSFVFLRKCQPQQAIFRIV
jgi:hypothetical protein